MFQTTDRHLYIHVPYCAKKCPYCDFNSIAQRDEEQAAYVAAILKELDSYRGISYRSIFIGGGTPTHLQPDCLEALLIGIRERIQLDSDYEWTCEANPGSSDNQQFEILHRHGVNRISIGVQSLHNHHLSFLGRIHDAQTAREAVQLACGLFDRVSCDIMFGLPNQTETELIDDLAIYKDCNLAHASVYHLTIEPGTEFHGLYQRGINKEIPQEDSWHLFQCVQQQLGAMGLSAYETSNFAKPGEACLHNLAYWNQRDYDAVGAGAVSTKNSIRATRLKHPGQYINAINQGSDAIWQSEQLSLHDLQVEAWMLGLRLIRGIEIAHLERLGDTTERWRAQADSFIADKLLTETDGFLAITQSGRPMQDHITAQLMP